MHDPWTDNSAGKAWGGDQGQVKEEDGGRKGSICNTFNNKDNF